MGSLLRVDGLANVRDLGGLPRRDGSRTPEGVFVRAEALDRVGDAGWERLHAHGIRTVIDLRRPQERSGEVPDAIARVNVDLDGDDAEFWTEYEADGRWGTPLYYLAHLQRLPGQTLAVARAVAAAADGGVLFHCGAGWDRTGLVAAVLLAAIDVIADAAVTDYLTSFRNAAAMELLHGRSFDVDERQGVVERFGHTPESAFRTMYDELDVPTWLDLVQADDNARHALLTWRGTAPPLPPADAGALTRNG